MMITLASNFSVKKYLWLNLFWDSFAHDMCNLFRMCTCCPTIIFLVYLLFPLPSSPFLLPPSPSPPLFGSYCPLFLPLAPHFTLSTLARNWNWSANLGCVTSVKYGEWNSPLPRSENRPESSLPLRKKIREGCLKVNIFQLPSNLPSFILPGATSDWRM